MVASLSVSRARVARIANAACWSLGLALLAWNFASVLRHAVDVPYWDDWAALDPGALDRPLRWAWLVGFHNVHRTVWTNLSIWLLYRLDGWNLAVHLALNFLLFAALAIGFLRSLERCFTAHLGPFLVPLASAIPDEIHLHASNGQWTFALGFAFLAWVFALRADRWSNLSPLFAVAAAFAMGTGVVLVLTGYVALLLALALLQPGRRIRIAAWGATVAAGIWWWARGYPSSPAPSTSPFSAAFWEHLGAMVAGGFGWSARPEPAVGWAILALLAASAVVTLLRLPRMDAPERVRWVALLCGCGAIVLALGSISLARAWAGVGGALSGRYLVVSMFLVAPLWLLVQRQLVQRAPERVQLPTSAVLLLALLLPFVRDLDFSERYGRQQARRLAGLSCIWQMVRVGLPPRCPAIQYDLAAAPVHHARALQLGLSYLRDLGPQGAAR